MLLQESQILEGQKKIIKKCKTRLFEDLDASANLIASLYQENTTISQEGQEAPLHTDITQKIKGYKHWISDLLDKAIFVSSIEEYDEPPPETIQLPISISSKLIQDLLQILTYGNNLKDGDLMFLSDVGNAINFSPPILSTLIEQAQYEKRKAFTELLLEHFNESQCQWVAKMLWEAIHVDQRVHPKEYKYFENVMHLLQYDQAKLNEMEKDINNILATNEPSFASEFNHPIFQYIVEIVMVDGEYSNEEAKFIKQIGASLGYDQHQQDQIIQPVASTLMLRQSLFI